MLDITTLTLVLAVTSVVSVIGLLVASQLNRQIAAIHYWAGGLAVFVLGLILQASSPPLSLWLSAVVITQAYLVIWWGTRVYRLGSNAGQVMLVMLVSLLVQGVIFFLLRDSLRFSVIFHSVLVLVFSALVVREVWLLGLAQRALVWVWAGLWAMHALVYLRRTILYLLNADFIAAETLQDAVTVEAINYVEGIAFIYGYSLLCVIFTALRLQEKLRHQASRDPLTNLLNRRAFEEAANPLLAAVQRGAPPLSILLLDLDHFKVVNDTHGHKVGDQVLKAFARQLHASARSGDLACRLGGEEFALLLVDADISQASRVAERLRLAWQQQSLSLGGASVDSSVSIGVSQASGVADESLYTLLDQADRSLYRAKKAGRNQVVAAPEVATSVATTAGLPAD
ncbi:MAG: GGDEF domain-containing protein [Pseudomonadaceae bacterium]|nr:MAG: GGDEF domain-containing protein [Pseudomonadaceae bacterium]